LGNTPMYFRTRWFVVANSKRRCIRRKNVLLWWVVMMGPQFILDISACCVRVRDWPPEGLPVQTHHALTHHYVKLAVWHFERTHNSYIANIIVSFSNKFMVPRELLFVFGFFLLMLCHECLMYWNFEDNNANLLTFLEISILWYKVHQIIDVR
jgi:hypothetical protein